MGIAHEQTWFSNYKNPTPVKFSFAFKSNEKKTIFKDNTPGRVWYQNFLARHPILSERVSQNLTSSRAAVTEQKIRSWFDEVQEYLASKNLLDIGADRVFNGDKSAFFLSPKGGSVLAEKGEKTVYSNVYEEKECVTTLICGNAAGNLAPPLIMFPYKRLPGNIASTMPNGWAVGHSDNGWMTGKNFYEYVGNVFYPWLVKNNIQFPVVLFVDGHCSHLTYPLSQLCKEKNIELVALYPNATHILQPMDVAVFRPLKAAWAKNVLEWRMKVNGERLRRHQFAQLLEKTLTGLDMKTILLNGFRTTGLHPFTAAGINYQKIFKTGASQETEELALTSDTTSDNKGSIKTCLNLLESVLEENVLFEFKQLENQEVWTGAFDLDGLFQAWRKIKRMADPDGKEILGAEQNHQHSQDSDEEMPPITEIFEEDGGSTIVISSNITQAEEEPVYMEMDTTPVIDDIIILPIDTDISGASSDLITEETLVTEENFPVCLESVTEKNPTFEKVVTEENLPASKQSGVEESQPTSGEPATESAGSKIIPSGMPSPFKNALFWPETTHVKNMKKAKKSTPKEKIPSIVTSEKWMDFQRHKIEKKEQEEKEKEIKKAERLRKKEIRQQQMEHARKLRQIKKEAIEARKLELKNKKTQKQTKKKNTSL